MAAPNFAGLSDAVAAYNAASANAVTPNLGYNKSGWKGADYLGVKSYSDPLVSAYNNANRIYTTGVNDYIAATGAKPSSVFALPEVQAAYNQVTPLLRDVETRFGPTTGGKFATPWEGVNTFPDPKPGGGFLKKALGIALPLAGSFFAPGLGTAIGSALGTSTALGTSLAGAGLGALTGKITGGNVLQSALLGGAGGYLAGGGFGDLTSSLGINDLFGTGVKGAEPFGPFQPGKEVFGPYPQAASGSVAPASLGRSFSSFLDNPIGTITNAAEDALKPDNLLKRGLKLGLSSALSSDNSGGYGAVQNAANTAAGYYQPFLQSGTAANKSIADLFGLNGQDAQRTAFGNFQTTPGYQFAKDQGIRALDASAAKRGMLLSGNQQQALQEFGTGLANQEFNNYLSNLMRTSAQGQAAADGVGQNQVDAATAYAALKANRANNRNSLYASLLDFL